MKDNLIPIGIVVGLVIVGILFFRKDTYSESTNIQYSTISPSTSPESIASYNAERESGISAAVASFQTLVGMSQAQLASDTAITLGGYDRDARIAESNNAVITYNAMIDAQRHIANLQHNEAISQQYRNLELARLNKKGQATKTWLDFFSNLGGNIASIFTGGI